MSRLLRVSGSFLAVLGLTTVLASGQGLATSTLSGAVVDSAGGVIPGASVVVKNDATGLSNTVVTTTAGTFSVPSIAAGTYTVTVSLQGFKAVSVKGVSVSASSVANIPKITLEVGQLSETVEVTAGTGLVQTQSPAISSTISTDQINNLPNSTRNALNFVTFLPGVDTTTTNRASTVMGLPQSTINITLDGASVQDNYLKSTDGFFSRVTPRPDAIEEVTVTTAGASASAAGQGAVQIAFVTRGGTNRYTGSVYEYYRDAALNSNYYFNKQNGLGKNEVTLHQYGAREGGPIVLPGLYDGRGKAFFFVNHEEFYQPTSISRTRIVMSDDARSGIYAYNITGGVQRVNLLQLAAANGQLATMDPTVQAQLAKIAAATTAGGTFTPRSEPNTVNWNYQFPSKRNEHQPTVRLDYNVSQKHRLTGTYTHQTIRSNPDILNSEEPRFPGFANSGAQASVRVSGSSTMRSTLSANLVNEASLSGSWGPSQFSPEIAVEQFAETKGYCVVLPDIGSDLTDLCTDSAPQSRAAPALTIGDTVNYLKGSHSFQFGGSFTRIGLALTDQVVVPTVNFNTDSTNDPASAFFTTANFPGASNAQLTAARAYYATLTGRMSSINSTSRLDENTGKYVYGGAATQRGNLDEYGMFVQDTWRVKPTLTMNFGLRYELEMPFSAGNSLYSTATLADVCGVSGTGPGALGRGCNLFMPGTLTGSTPMFTQYQTGKGGYQIDKNNFAPNIGVAWRPDVKSGFLRAVLGDPEQATIRGGYSVAYNRNGMADFTGIYGGNPGITATANRNVTNGNLVPAGGTFPVLFRNDASLGPPATCAAGTVSTACVPDSRSYPFASTRSNNLNIFDPTLQVSFSRSYTIGFQRALSKDMAIEVRYVGTRNVGGWTTENWNELNITTNGFLDEFKLAQVNLQANVAAGRGNSFAYFGTGTGTSPLPVMLAYLTGTPKALAADTTRYTASLFTNTTLTGRLGILQPQPGPSAGNNNLANDLENDATRRANAIAAGLPANYFKVNPDAGTANVRTGGAFTKYDSAVIEVRRRLTQGLLVSGNYTFGSRYASSLDTIQRPRYLDYSTDGVRHAVKLNWTYEVPVGRGKRYGADMSSWLNAVIGGWEWDGTGRLQSGRIVDAGNLRLVGMSSQELQSLYELRKGDDGFYYMLPQDIIDNTIKAFSTSATSLTGYGALGAPTGRYIAPPNYAGCVQAFAGDCAPRHAAYLTGPKFARFDMSIKKLFSIGGRRTIAIELDELNVFDAVNFNPVFTTSTTATNYRVSSGYTDTNNTFDPGGRLGQVVARFSW